ncbi:hypothetical protein PO909_022038 [Leuciscus waleckii]
MCDVTRDTPVRKLRFSTLRALSDQLDPQENWRSVMMDISGTSGEPIYSQLHIRYTIIIITTTTTTIIIIIIIITHTLADL